MLTSTDLATYCGLHELDVAYLCQSRRDTVLRPFHPGAGFLAAPEGLLCRETGSFLGRRSPTPAHAAKRLREVR